MTTGLYGPLKMTTGLYGPLMMTTGLYGPLKMTVEYKFDCRHRVLNNHLTVSEKAHDNSMEKKE